MKTIDILNEILKVVGSCDTCYHGAEDLKKVDDGGSWCYMFKKRPTNCRCYKPVANPLEHFINLALEQESNDEG